MKNLVSRSEAKTQSRTMFNAVRRLILIGTSCLVLLAATSPEEREITDPRSVVSVSNPAAGPIPISQCSNPSKASRVLSPDGKWIVFEQAFGGGELYDLFEAPRDGGELINLTNTSEVHPFRSFRPRW